MSESLANAPSLESTAHSYSQALALGFPRFRGHGSGVHRGECTGSDERLLVVDRTQVADR